MKQIKNRFLIASVAATLAAMLATASILTGCGSNDEETDETKVITETQLVTKIVNGVFTDEEGNQLDGSFIDSSIFSYDITDSNIGDYFTRKINSRI